MVTIRINEIGILLVIIEINYVKENCQIIPNNNWNDRNITGVHKNKTFNKNHRFGKVKDRNRKFSNRYLRGKKNLINKKQTFSKLMMKIKIIRKVIQHLYENVQFLRT